jgi:glucose-6-phosphate isomerase
MTVALRLEIGGAIDDQYGLRHEQLEALYPKLDQLRREIADTDPKRYEGTAPIPTGYEPLDARFAWLPQEIVTDYRARRDASELGRIFAVSQMLHDSVDRVVVLGIGGSYMGARALMDACCHPYHNLQTRGQRGSKPRMFFEGNNVDNDASQALLEWLREESSSATSEVGKRWAIVVISKSGGTLETAVALRQFVASLESQLGSDAAKWLGKLVVPVTGADGKLADFSKRLGCEQVFSVPDGVGGRFSVLSSVGLLPAAIIGLDVMQLLDGAVAMTKHFETAPAAENLVLRYVAVNHLLELHRGCDLRVMSVWSKALEAVGLWYDQLFAESIGKQGKGATPLTTVNTRDLHSRHQQHQQGKNNKVFNNIIVDRYRSDPLAVGMSDRNEDGLNDIAKKTLPDVMAAAIQGTNEALHSDGRPTLNIHLPSTSTFAIGQLMQMLMLATVVEGRLLGINPYGQPGVEAYKKNMSRILGRK